LFSTAFRLRKRQMVPISEHTAPNRGGGAYLNVLVMAHCYAKACRSCRDGHFFWPKETKALKVKVKTSGEPWQLRLVQRCIDYANRHHCFKCRLNSHLTFGVIAQTPEPHTRTVKQLLGRKLKLKEHVFV